jgi:hypothetical protein
VVAQRRLAQWHSGSKRAEEEEGTPQGGCSPLNAAEAVGKGGASCGWRGGGGETGGSRVVAAAVRTRSA